ncbi:DUF6415 family natural product biosynthesis protein [Streptomyces lavendulae]|uniref:DUF6415 family natural product biosynthesis protein n=1 Tax=Streptomyces lavendulae TaxID=1914 RepID=UPI00369C26BF
MTTSTTADACVALDGPDASLSLPVDTVGISESVSIILEPRDVPPPAALRALWLSWLSGHINLLLPAIVTARRHQSTDAVLVADTAAFVHDILEHGLPEDPQGAYVQLQELARTCRFLLGLATDLAREPR